MHRDQAEKILKAKKWTRNKNVKGETTMVQGNSNKFFTISNDENQLTRNNNHHKLIKSVQKKTVSPMITKE